MTKFSLSAEIVYGESYEYYDCIANQKEDIFLNKPMRKDIMIITSDN